MQTGLERLFRYHPKLIQGKKISLLAHPASVDKNFRHVFEILREKHAHLIRLFGPEHGFFGQAQDMEAVSHRLESPIPMVSLYGSTIESLTPQKKYLEETEVLIVDLQDVGARYYTYAYTLAFCLQMAAQTQTQVIVLDRPNPINGRSVEGNTVAKDYRSFVGYYPLANRHGMTLGELAHFFNEECNLKADLKVIPMKGWHRARYMDETNIPWVLPSPNMPTVDTAVVYPGMCLLEGTELSEGRGTTRPFEIFGAPYIDSEALVRRLQDFRLPGVRFRPTVFKPTFQKHAGGASGGAQIHVTKRKAFKSLLTGVAILKAALDLYPEDFKWRERAYEFVEDKPAIDLLAGNDQLRKQLKAGLSLKKIEESWEEERQDFLKIRKQYLLYT